MNLLSVQCLVLITLLKCFASGEIGENSVLDRPPEKSRFKKFLNLFGIGTMKQFQPGDNFHEFSPYGYPCQTVTTTTTTPAPVAMSPLLCPFPPMMPGQSRPNSGGPEMPPKVFYRPLSLDQLPPPPPGGFPHGPSQTLPGNINHQPSFPPSGLLPGLKPPPGQNPQFPGQSLPPFPGQNLPNHVPIQNLPQPVHPNQSQGGPNNPSVFRPNPINPEQPTLVDPVNINPENPIRVNPANNSPYDPVKVNPVDIDLSQPLLVDPVQQGHPLPVDSVNNGESRPPYFDPSMIPSDPKEFNKHQPLLPYGPMNVLINPGLPDSQFFPPSNNLGPFNPPPSLHGDNLGPPPPIQNQSGPSNSTPTAVDPPLVRPDPPPRPPCASPFLKPYIPNGFHFTSVKQLIGLPPLPNHRLFPCPTLDLLTVLEFKTMRSLIVTSGLEPLVEHTRNYTLFVPSDAAFRRLPKWFRESLNTDPKLKKALVLNHLVKDDLYLSRLKNEELILSARPGGNRLRVNIYQPESSYRTITVDGSEIEMGDIITSNGRVHIVNKVLMPNLPRNAAQFLSEKLEFEGFWNHVKQANLVQRFQDPSPFTLFIPINEAVRRLNDSTFLNDHEKSKNFVNYHMVNGTYYSSGIVNNEFLLTNYEKEIKLQVVTDSFAKSLAGINGKVRILKADITLTNGVAHVIDQAISEETPFYVFPQSDEFKNEFGVMKRSFRVTSEEKNIENAF